jgi:hypothetical protein
MYLTAFSVIFFYMAFFTSDLVTRYLMPALPALIIIMVIGIRNTFELRFKAVAVLGALVLALLFAFNVNYAAGLYSKYAPVSYLAGPETREEYLTRMAPDYEAVTFANVNLPERALVLMLFAGDRGYYWDRELAYWSPYGGELIRLVRGSGTADEISAKLEGLGVTHLFIKDLLLEKFAVDNFEGGEYVLIQAFFRLHTARMFSSNGFSLYVLR